jgi:hypothetical protein
MINAEHYQKLRDDYLLIINGWIEQAEHIRMELRSEGRWDLAADYKTERKALEEALKVFCKLFPEQLETRMEPTSTAIGSDDIKISFSGELKG